MQKVCIEKIRLIIMFPAWIRTHGHAKLHISREGLHTSLPRCQVINHDIRIASSFTCWLWLKLYKLGARKRNYLWQIYWLVFVVLDMYYNISSRKCAETYLYVVMTSRKFDLFSKCKNMMAEKKILHIKKFFLGNFFWSKWMNLVL